MLKIGDFSKISRVSIRMLRHYDEIDLLKPIQIDPFTGYRYYSEEQLLVVGRIMALKNMGFRLSTIREIMEAYEDREQLETFLNVKRAELIALQDETAERLRLLDTAMERLRKDENMSYNVTVKTLPERYVASVRMVIPSYDHEGMVWGIFYEETKDMNLVYTDPRNCSVAYHDKEFKESDVDIELQETVQGNYPDTEHVKFKTVPEVTFASTVYKGSYEHINDAYGAVVSWLNGNGYEMAGPMFNIYHVSPAQTENPEEYVTEVCCPVKKK